MLATRFPREIHQHIPEQREVIGPKFKASILEERYGITVSLAGSDTGTKQVQDQDETNI